MKTKPNINFVGADWKDINGLAESFTKVLEHYGLYVYEDPTTEGSDWYGYVVSDIELNKKELRAAVKEELGPIFEENS